MQAAAQDALLAGNSFQEAAPAATPNPAREFAGGAAPLNDAQEACISVLQSGAMTRRLPILNIQYGEHAWEPGFGRMSAVRCPHLEGKLCPAVILLGCCLRNRPERRLLSKRISLAVSWSTHPMMAPQRPQQTRRVDSLAVLKGRLGGYGSQATRRGPGLMRSSLTPKHRSMTRPRADGVPRVTGVSPNDSIGMPVAAWIISECLLNWAGRWGALEAEQVGHRLRDAILSSAEAEGLTYQCYWLSTAIALGGIMRVRQALHGPTSVPRDTLLPA